MSVEHLIKNIRVHVDFLVREYLYATQEKDILNTFGSPYTKETRFALYVAWFNKYGIDVLGK